MSRIQIFSRTTAPKTRSASKEEEEFIELLTKLSEIEEELRKVGNDQQAFRKLANSQKRVVEAFERTDPTLERAAKLLFS